MILKAGTYRFNDVLTYDNNFFVDSNELYSVSLPFNSNGNNYISLNIIALGGGYQAVTYSNGDDVVVAYSSVTSVEMGLNEGWVDGYQTHTITKDTEVDETFGTWYIPNTNYNEVNPTHLATIEYNGQVIASLNAGKTGTLSCKGKKMISDLIVKIL